MDFLTLFFFIDPGSASEYLSWFRNRHDEVGCRNLILIQEDGHLCLKLMIDGSPSHHSMQPHSDQRRMKTTRLRIKAQKKKSPATCGAKVREETAPKLGQLHDTRGAVHPQRIGFVIHNHGSLNALQTWRTLRHDHT